MNLNDAKAFTYWIAKLVLTAMVVGIILSWLPIGRDTTDPAWPGRSGMGHFTDHETGCQYLSNPKGGITPRLSKTGRHVGCQQD